MKKKSLLHHFALGLLIGVLIMPPQSRMRNGQSSTRRNTRFKSQKKLKRRIAGFSITRISSSSSRH